MLQVVLDGQTISMTIVEKHFSFFCGVSIFVWFCVEKIENGPSER
jgi:hypothetical protein